MHKVRSWGNISRQDTLFELCCAGPNRFKAAQNAAHTLGSFSQPEFLKRGADPRTVKQCALHAVAASLVRESGALHGACANAGFDVPLGDSVCFDRVSGFLQVGAGATPSRCVPPCGQRDSDQTTDVDGEFCETDRLHEVLETTAALSLAAETDQLHAESGSSGAHVCWHPGGHSARRGRVGGLRLRGQAHSRLGDFVLDPLSSSHHVDHVHTRNVGCAHGEHDLHECTHEFMSGYTCCTREFIWVAHCTREFR